MNTNVNCFSLMHNACKKLKGNFWRAFLATLVVVAPLVAVSFIPYYVGIILAVFCSGYLFYGLIIYYKKLFAGEKPSLNVIFNNWDKFGAATLMGIINVISLVVGLIVLIFPSLAYMTYYGVNLHILSDQTETKVGECFSQNSERMITHRTLVLSYKVLCYFLFTLIIGACAIAFMPIVSLSATNYALAVFLSLMVVVVGIVLLTFANVLYQATQMEFYTTCLPSKEESDNYRKAQNEKIIAKRKNKETAKDATVENKADEKNEEDNSNK